MTKPVRLDRDDLTKWRDIQARAWAIEQRPDDHDVREIQGLYKDHCKFWEEAYEKYELDPRNTYYISPATGLIKYSEEPGWSSVMQEGESD